MSRVEKTVFISYRRTNVAWALAISQDLTQHGFDIFFDFRGIASGDFEQVILQNIRARAHFIVLLTPSALDRCGDPGDWLRREIEEALDTERNIVPLMLEGFDFSVPSMVKQLTGKLSTLKQYNALRVPPDFFDEAMERLRKDFLSVPLTSVLHPASTYAQANAAAQQAAVSAAPLVSREALAAQQWSEAFGLQLPKAHLVNDDSQIQEPTSQSFTHRAKVFAGGTIRNIHELALEPVPPSVPGEKNQLGPQNEREQFEKPVRTRSWRNVFFFVLGILIIVGLLIWSVLSVPVESPTWRTSQDPARPVIDPHRLPPHLSPPDHDLGPLFTKP